MKETTRRFQLSGSEEQMKALAEVFKTRGKDLTRHDLYIILTTMEVAEGITEEDCL